MPAQLTYTSLVSDVIAYTERRDAAFIAQIPRLVMMAENRIATELKTLGFQTVVLGQFVQNAAVVPKPAYWRQMISLSYADSTGQRVELLLRQYEYLRGIYHDDAKSGPPRYYAEYNFDHLLIAPKPDQAYDFEMVYYARLQPLDPATQTNWMTRNVPQLLFYAVMIEANVFLKNADSATYYQQLYDRAATAIGKEDDDRVMDRGTKVATA